MFIEYFNIKCHLSWKNSNKIFSIELNRVEENTRVFRQLSISSSSNYNHTACSVAWASVSENRRCFELHIIAHCSIENAIIGVRDVFLAV